ncbi:hypothetical protein ACTXT7_000388 [Hymenolepis weldensis]
MPDVNVCALITQSLRHQTDPQQNPKDQFMLNLFPLINEPFLASRRKSLVSESQQNSFSPSKTFRPFRSYTTPSQNEQRGRGEGPSGSTAVVNRVRDQQSNWKGCIEAQRERVFGERTILN